MVFTKFWPGLLCLLLFACSKRYSKTTGESCASFPSGEKKLGAQLGLDDALLNTHTAVYPLENGGESLVTRAWLCENAQKTIDIQYYIFSRDNTGLITCDYLVCAADRGVKIRLLVDDVTVQSGSTEMIALDSHKNIEIKMYNPGVKVGRLGLRLKKMLTMPHKLHRRMHNKTITVDGEIAITGGRNIADEYFDYHKSYNFRDRDVLFAGREVKAVSRSFEAFWHDSLSVALADLVSPVKRRNQEDRYQRLHAYACDRENFSELMRAKVSHFPRDFRKTLQNKKTIWLKAASFVSDVPGKNEDRAGNKGGVCTDSLIALLQGAKKTVEIQSPYVILTEQGYELFTDLVKRGVKVRILTNSLGSTDNHEAFSGYQRDREKILATGIEIYEYKPHAPARLDVMVHEVQAALSYTPVYGMHAKTMIIDGHTAVIGSFNLDPRSVNLNTECVLIMRSAELAKNLAFYLETEMQPANAWRISKDFNPDKEAGPRKRVKIASRKAIPKRVL